MINNEMAERFHKKAKEIYYRNFFILIKKLNSNEIINEDNELTSDELRSGLHTCITLFFKINNLSKKLFKINTKRK
jgi:hypothetical protein